MQKNTIAVMEMVICAMLWSIAGIFMKLLPWNAFAVASLRAVFAALTIGLYMLVTHRKFIFNRQTIISAVINSAVSICFSCANKMTTSANAIVLQYTSPVFIVIFSALFKKQRIRKQDMITVLITLLGISLFFFDQLQPGYILGNLVAILSGVLMATMFMLVGDLDIDSRYSSITLAQVITVLVGLPVVFVTRPEITGTSAAAVIILGVLQLGIAYILYVKASLLCSPLACCLLAVIEPLLSPVWVAVFAGEKPGVFALIGGAIIIVTITLWCAMGNQKNDAA